MLFRAFILVFVFILINACSYKSDLPVLSYQLINGNKEYYKVNNFSFVNQNNQIVDSSSTANKVHTINFFFTSCPSICPPMKIKQLELSEEFKNENDFKQYSISIDLKRDTVKKLKYYSEVSEINSDKWNLLKASNEVDLNKIAKALKTNFKPNKDGTDFYHSSYVALLDKSQQIRGFYDLLSEKEFELLKKDIQDLLKEKLK